LATFAGPACFAVAVVVTEEVADATEASLFTPTVFGALTEVAVVVAAAGLVTGVEVTGVEAAGVPTINGNVVWVVVGFEGPASVLARFAGGLDCAGLGLEVTGFSLRFEPVVFVLGFEGSINIFLALLCSSVGRNKILFVASPKNF
jgi:hypothetical protein